MTLLSRRALLASLAAGRPEDPLFAGTFFQPWRHHHSWTPATWRALFEALSALGTREIVLQWSRYGDLDHTPVAGALLDLAAGFGMTVTVGLHHDASWWQAAAAHPQAALDALTERARRFAASPAASFEHHPAFAGWYLPEEIVDDHWIEPARRRKLLDAVKTVARIFHPLSASGFTNRSVPPPALASLWRELTGRGRLSRALLQDGIGAGKTTLDTWPDYLKPLARALGKRLNVVVEIFESPAGETAFRAAPAPLGRILAQVRLARAATRRPPLCFSLPDYATPAGGKPAAILYEQLLTAIRR